MELAPIGDPALVVPTIAQALGVHGIGDRPPARQPERILRQQRLLLLLDNFEHVLSAAPAVAELLGGLPRL